MQVEQAGTPQSERTPFFLCAGMFGNVMNLRHLAGHIGVDQPFYGLQARGVDGKSEPHRTFEEQASAVNAACLSADARWAISASQDKALRLWEVETGRCLRTF